MTRQQKAQAKRERRARRGSGFSNYAKTNVKDSRREEREFYAVADAQRRALQDEAQRKNRSKADSAMARIFGMLGVFGA